LLFACNHKGFDIELQHTNNDLFGLLHDAIPFKTTVGGEVCGSYQ
jgi:hypothetical protein